MTTPNLDDTLADAQFDAVPGGFVVGPLNVSGQVVNFAGRGVTRLGGQEGAPWQPWRIRRR